MRISTSVILFSLTWLPLSLALRGRALEGPRRVRIPAFTITLSPAKLDLTALDALEVRDVAETLFEAHLEGHEWSSSTIYDYAGLSGIEHVSIDESKIPAVSIIKVRGGLVVFDETSSWVPSVEEVVAMLDQSINEGNALTDSLESTTDFNFVESAAYELFPTPSQSPSLTPSVSPSEAPSLAPSVSPSEAPSPASSVSPSEAPSFDTDVSALENEKVVIGDSGNGSPTSSGVIGGVVAGFVVTGVVVALLMANRRGQQADHWKTDNPHVHPRGDQDASGLHKKDSLQGFEVSEAKSEAGSSMLGRLLTAAAPPPRAVLNDSPDTTPHCSSDSEEESSMDTFDGGTTMILPSILRLNSLESFQVDRHMSTANLSVKKQILEPDGLCVPAEWRNDSHIQPFQCALTSTDVSSAIHFDKWSDCSSSYDPNTEKVHEASDTGTEGGNFAPDESWDFQDNDEEASDMTVDPFYTPANPEKSESMTQLLRNFMQFSS